MNTMPLQEIVTQLETVFDQSQIRRISAAQLATELIRPIAGPPKVESVTALADWILGDDGYGLLDFTADLTTAGSEDFDPARENITVEDARALASLPVGTILRDERVECNTRKHWIVTEYGVMFDAFDAPLTGDRARRSSWGPHQLSSTLTELLSTFGPLVIVRLPSGERL